MLYTVYCMRQIFEQWKLRMRHVGRQRTERLGNHCLTTSAPAGSCRPLPFGWLAGKCVDAFYNTHWDQHGVCVIMNSIIISLICAARRINCSQGKQLAKASGVAGALILRAIKNNLGRFGVMYPISPGLTPFAIPIPRTLLLEHLPFVVCHLAFWHGRCCSPALLYSPVCVC